MVMCCRWKRILVIVKELRWNGSQWKTVPRFSVARRCAMQRKTLKRQKKKRRWSNHTWFWSEIWRRPLPTPVDDEVILQSLWKSSVQCPSLFSTDPRCLYFNRAVVFARWRYTRLVAPSHILRKHPSWRIIYVQDRDQHELFNNQECWLFKYYNSKLRRWKEVFCKIFPYFKMSRYLFIEIPVRLPVKIVARSRRISMEIFHPWNA